MKHFTLLLVSYFFMNCVWGQDCRPKELIQEEFNSSNELKERQHYLFSYHTNGELDEITVNDDQRIKFEKVEQGLKVIWYWDDEIDTYFLMTKDTFFEFSGEDDSILDAESADDSYAVDYNDNGSLAKVNHGPQEQEIFMYTNGVLTERDYYKRERSWKNTYTHSEIKNPFKALWELGLLQISMDNFIPYIFTQSPTLIATERTIKTESEAIVADESYTFSSKSDEANCPTEYIVPERYGSTSNYVYKFVY